MSVGVRGGTSVDVAGKTKVGHGALEDGVEDPRETVIDRDGAQDGARDVDGVDSPNALPDSDVVLLIGEPVVAEDADDDEGDTEEDVTWDAREGEGEGERGVEGANDPEREWLGSVFEFHSVRIDSW